jgi:hypothetical protein
VDTRAEMTREAHGGTLKALGVTTQAAAEATTEADRLMEALKVAEAAAAQSQTARTELKETLQVSVKRSAE